MINEEQSDLAERRASVEEALTTRKEELKSLAADEAKYSEGLDAELLFKFQRIIKNKGGKGIVPLRAGVCSGCHMILPAQFANNVRAGEEIVFCPYCSRILYYEEVPEEEEALFEDDTMGGLADLEEGGDEADEEEEEEGDFEEV
jgi:predicted  nucleic acid-binding Zn-ribbon protein